MPSHYPTESSRPDTRSIAVSHNARTSPGEDEEQPCKVNIYARTAKRGLMVATCNDDSSSLRLS